MRPLLILLFAACSGSPSARPTTAARETAPTAAPAHDFEAELARIDALADQVCGCTTVPCFEEADRAVGAYLDVGSLFDPITGVDPWPAELAPRYDAASARASDCFEAAEFLPPETNDHFTLRRLEIAADHACACTTDECRAELRDALVVLDEDYLYSPTSDASIARMRGADARIARCLGGALDAPIADAVAVIGAARDQACACPDRACVRAPSRAFIDWVAARGTLSHVLLAVSEVGEALAALEACVRERT